MAMTLLATNPDSTDVVSAEFTSLIDSTYKLYIFKFIDIHPETDAANFQFQVNAAGASGYNETITSTSFRSSHAEDNSSASLEYVGGRDQAQGTGFQDLENGSVGADNDQSLAGTLWLFNPSSTTYVKHFYSRTNSVYHTDETMDSYRSGYFNTALAIDEIQFQFNSGNMNGTIKMYGVG